MICIICNKEYDGPSRRCEWCGTVYSPREPVFEHAVKEVRETAVVKKKKASKK